MRTLEVSATSSQVISALSSWWLNLDAGVAWCLFPLAIIVLVSGMDDLALDAICLAAWVRRRFRSPRATPVCNEGAAKKTIAVFVPLWHEHAVIAGMVEHNA